MKVLIIDNYDSFTYNLVHLVQQFTDEFQVYRNDEFDIQSVGEFDKILLSPGPGLPPEAGLMMEVMEKYAPLKSIMGICLGMQSIALAFGGRLVNLDFPKHGESSMCVLNGTNDYLWKGINSSFKVGHYHSWVIDESSLPRELEITLKNEEGIIMAIRHRHYDVRGVQFHPESILTPIGKKIIFNWLEGSEIEL